MFAVIGIPIKKILVFHPHAVHGGADAGVQPEVVIRATEIVSQRSTKPALGSA